MASTFDVLVIGGGVIGTSIAFHLTTQGVRRVLVCDQGSQPCTGATVRSAGMVRMHHSNPWQARLAWQSYPTFAHWDDIVGGDCGFRQTGFALAVGPDQLDTLAHNCQMLRDLGIPLLTCTPEDFQAIMPLCDTSGIGGVTYEPFSGYANPVSTTDGFLRAARRHGAEFLAGTAVERLLVENGRVRGVSTNFGSILADTVVLASNVGAALTLSQHGVDLPVTPKRIGICRIALPEGTSARPACIVTDDTLHTYFRPEGSTQTLVGIAPTGLETGLAAPRPIQADEAQDHLARFHMRFPRLRHAVIGGAWAAVEGYTPDKHALIGPLQALDGLYIAAGFSGGGFKIAPAVGRAVADELIGGRAVPELAAFRPERFEQQRLISSDRPYRYL